jgi:hypothetical protein
VVQRAGLNWSFAACSRYQADENRRSQMKGHGAKFGRKQEAAIIGLLTMPTMEQAAKHADISATSLWRWMQDTAFQAKYREARRQAVGQATAQLQQASSAAVQALREIIEDPTASTNARVTAARCWNWPSRRRKSKTWRLGSTALSRHSQQKKGQTHEH